MVDKKTNTPQSKQTNRWLQKEIYLQTDSYKHKNQIEELMSEIY